jgi:hypothetical protein
MKQSEIYRQMRRTAPTPRKVLPTSQHASGTSEWTYPGEHQLTNRTGLMARRRRYAKATTNTHPPGLLAAIAGPARHDRFTSLSKALPVFRNNGIYEEVSTQYANQCPARAPPQPHVPRRRGAVLRPYRARKAYVSVSLISTPTAYWPFQHDRHFSDASASNLTCRANGGLRRGAVRPTTSWDTDAGPGRKQRPRGVHRSSDRHRTASFREAGNYISVRDGSGNEVFEANRKTLLSRQATRSEPNREISRHRRDWPSKHSKVWSLGDEFCKLAMEC